MLDLTRVKAYRRLDETLHTAGQPTREELRALGAAGIRHVINLAMADSDGALADEAALLRAQGIGYDHQPIVFTAPSREHLRRFGAALEQHESEPILVHCALNMRVSAMIFMDRIDRKGIAPETALPDLTAIWTPGGPWRELIDSVLQDNGHPPLPA